MSAKTLYAFFRADIIFDIYPSTDAVRKLHARLSDSWLRVRVRETLLCVLLQLSLVRAGVHLTIWHAILIPHSYSGTNIKFAAISVDIFSVSLICRNAYVFQWIIIIISMYYYDKYRGPDFQKNVFESLYELIELIHSPKFKMLLYATFCCSSAKSNFNHFHSPDSAVYLIFFACVFVLSKCQNNCNDSLHNCHTNCEMCKKIITSNK